MLDPHSKWPGRMMAVGLVLILLATLFPFSFSLRRVRSFSDSFGLKRSMTARPTDLFIGVDGALDQPFKGRLDELEIDARARSASDIERMATQLARDANASAAYSFDEGAGDSVKDLSGNGNEGRLINHPQWVDGRRGGALRFNGTNQYIRVPNSRTLDISGSAFTISMWVALEDTPSTLDQVIVSKPWRNGALRYPWHQYAVEFDANDAKTIDLYLSDSRGRSLGQFGLKAPIGPWTHIAFTFDGRTVRGFVDGREQLESDVSEPWHIGDIFANILLFMPFGFGLAWTLKARRYSNAGAVLSTLLASLFLSLAVECLQMMLPRRDPSLIDVATNTLGAVLAAAAAVSQHRAAFGERVQ